jgi:hypothetical protein
MASNPAEPVLSWLAGLCDFQEAYAIPVKDSSTHAPAAVLSSLREAAKNAPSEYADYLAAVECYERQLYRAAILMVWAATIEHMYGVVADHRGGVRKIQAANLARYGTHNKYREVKRKNDLLYLSEDQCIQLAEDAGMINRNARRALADSLTLRNLCGHPTIIGRVAGRQ